MHERSTDGCQHGDPSLAGVALAVAPADHILFGMTGASALPPTQASHDRPTGKGEAVTPASQTYLTPPYVNGNHGFGPVRGDYGSVYLLVVHGVAPKHLGRIEMTTIYERLAKELDLSCAQPGREDSR